jgi:hypothetical protein
VWRAFAKQNERIVFSHGSPLDCKAFSHCLAHNLASYQDQELRWHASDLTNKSLDLASPLDQESSIQMKLHHENTLYFSVGTRPP